MTRRTTDRLVALSPPSAPPIDSDASGVGIPTVETDEDQILNLSLRPKGFGEFVGQQAVVDNLHVAIQATQRRGEPLEHLLLAGPPGLGKTSLAHIVSQEMGSKITATSGPAIERAGDLIGVLT
ncbi:MAG: AAA family ATPase, partial [Candidatus Omnitrophica bacterium]|nr:AAA family ATPase [Candidatus Omnitrophota bacterium]